MIRKLFITIFIALVAAFIWELGWYGPIIAVILVLLAVTVIAGGNK